MEPSPERGTPHPFASGDRVRVADASSPRNGSLGVVVFSVADNIYVKFDDRRWTRTKMFFPEQLRTAAGATPTPHQTGAATFVDKLRDAVFKRRP